MELAVFFLSSAYELLFIYMGGRVLAFAERSNSVSFTLTLGSFLVERVLCDPYPARCHALTTLYRLHAADYSISDNAYFVKRQIDSTYQSPLEVII